MYLRFVVLFQQVCHFVKLDYVVNDDGDYADADVDDLIVDCIVLVNFDLVDHLVQIVLRLPETNSLVEVFVIDSKQKYFNLKFVFFKKIYFREQKNK